MRKITSDLDKIKEKNNTIFSMLSFHFFNLLNNLNCSKSLSMLIKISNALSFINLYRY